VVDGRTENYLYLKSRSKSFSYRHQILLLSRNFGSWPAINAGLEAGRGEYFAIMSADMQEPPELIERFVEVLVDGSADIAIGQRERRSDPPFSRLCSNLYWGFYRRLVNADVPRGGADVFAVTAEVRDLLISLREANTSLVALLFWVGFRRKLVGYSRQARIAGKSNWSFAKKVRHALNGAINFSDIPIQALLYVGVLGLVCSLLGIATVIVAKVLGVVNLPGYAATVCAIGFFGGLSSFGLGILGQYLWLVLQNVRGRPNYVVMIREDGTPAVEGGGA